MESIARATKVENIHKLRRRKVKKTYELTL